MALINLEELKSVLGIGDIYPDAEVQEVADAAENIILSYLAKNQFAVIAHSRSDNVETIYTQQPHGLFVGASVEVSNCGQGFNGTHTLTAVTTYSMSFSGSGAQYPKHPIIPSGTVAYHQYIDYDDIPEIRLAALITAEDIWMTRMGVTGQQGVDFQPAPYRLSRGLVTRVSALMAKYVDTGSLIG